ncbi:MAG TPA: hypothetical protein VLX32_12930 [Candidatus Acidoferrum sp.]|nr:hypothetical protein [Candidatus Acidoferrum sp.]
MPAIQLREARRRSTLLEWAVHSSEYDFVARDVNNDPATREGCDNFIVGALARQLGFNTVGGETRQESAEEYEEQKGSAGTESHGPSDRQKAEHQNQQNPFYSSAAPENHVKEEPAISSKAAFR